MKLPLTLSLALAGALLSATAPDRQAGITLRVAVLGVSGDDGEVGCALYAAADGFPMNASTARQVWLTPRKNERGEVSCVFSGVATGSYAVAVSWDRNGNRVTDTGLFGIPTEAWGVSQNARPAFRAPRFDEARFEVDGRADVNVSVTVAK